MILFLFSILLSAASETPAQAYAPACQITGFVSAKNPETLTVTTYGVLEGKESKIASIHPDDSGRYGFDFAVAQRNLYANLIVRLTDAKGKVLSEKTIPARPAPGPQKKSCRDTVDF